MLSRISSRTPSKIHTVIIITLFIIVALFVRSSYESNETNLRCTFTGSDISEIWIIDNNNHGLSYDYKISDSDALEISNNLIKSAKKTISLSNIQRVEGGISFIIIFPGKSITLYPNDNNSVYAVLSKKGSCDKTLLVRSTWLPLYLKKVRGQFN